MKDRPSGELLLSFFGDFHMYFFPIPLKCKKYVENRSAIGI